MTAFELTYLIYKLSHKATKAGRLFTLDGYFFYSENLYGKINIYNQIGKLKCWRSSKNLSNYLWLFTIMNT